MQFISSHTVRLGRRAAAILTTAAALALAGCQSGPVSNDTMGGGSNNSGGGGSPGSAVRSSDSGPGYNNNNNGGNTSNTNTSGNTQDNGSGNFDTTAYFPNGSKSGEVLMLQAMGPRSIRMGKDATVQIKVTNLTGNTVHNVMLSSTNPDGFQVTGAGSATTQPMDKGMGFAVGDIGSKDSKTVTVTGMATKVGSVDTCYVATYNPPTLCTMLTVTNPAINLAVQAPADIDICKQATYTYTVTNTGTGTAHNVQVTEDLPDGLTTADGGKTVSNTIGDIPQGESRNFTAPDQGCPHGQL